MLQFYFIRHGQSANNLLYDTTGSDTGRSSDPELTETGFRQAELLGTHLLQENIHLTHLYTSLMVRAVATGSLVAHRLGLPLVAWPDLHEEGGIYLNNELGEQVGQPGKDRTFFEAHFPGLVLPETLNASGWWNRPYEFTAERPIRAQRFVRGLFAQHGGTDHRVAVISHGGFYNLVLADMLKLSKEQRLWFTLQNTAITRIDFCPDRTDFVYHNRVNFLPRDMIT